MDKATYPDRSVCIENAIAQLLKQIAEPHVLGAIEALLRALLFGLGDKIVSCEICGENKIRVTLCCSMVGVVATRSRLPVEWLLQKTFHLWIEDSSRLCLDGVEVLPFEGALEAFKILKPQFVKADAKTVNEKSAVAWQWWDKDGGREAFKNTKMWRCVESLACLGYGKVVPTYAMATTVLGYSLSVRQNLTSLHYRFHARERVVDVVGTLVTPHRDPSNTDFDGDAEIKDTIGRTMFTEYCKSASRRMVANKFATSSWNYGALFCTPENKLAATPSSVEKFFTVARNRGGASKRDVLKGRANSWQFDDETYQMTGDDGRVVWMSVESFQETWRLNRLELK